MTLDRDGKIRVDCFFPSAMAPLRRAMIPDEDSNTLYGTVTSNNADSDRHGTVMPDDSVDPSHYLTVAVDYLFQHRPGWKDDIAVGKTLVSSALIDRVAALMGRRFIEIPVSFKCFVPGLLDGSVSFGDEESVGASFLCKDGTMWPTGKDGIILALLASGILTATGKTPLQLHTELVGRFGASAHARIDAPTNREQKAELVVSSPENVTTIELAGEPVTTRLVCASESDAAIGGLKVTTENAWFTVHPSGTKDVYKIYTKSFKGAEYLAEVQEEVEKVVSDALG